MNAGPLPARACAIARAAASRTTQTLMPSIVSAGTSITSARARISPAVTVTERRVLAVAVVLAHEHERQLQHLREVEALEDVALVHRAVAEVRDRDAARRPRQRERRAGGGRDAAADDPERADQPVGGRRHVHRAGAAAVHAGRAPEHLVEQRLRVDAERERVAVAAVRRRDAVALLEQARDAGRHRLLARVQMRRAVDLALAGRATARDPRSRGSGASGGRSACTARRRRARARSCCSCRCCSAR